MPFSIFDPIKAISTINLCRAWRMSLFGLTRDAISKSREYAEALHYYERALDAEPEDERRRPRIVQEALRAVLKPDWDGVAAMKARLGDRDGVRETLEMGAWERDDPMAWYQLARMHEQDSTLMRDYLR
jgi:hypothetical protein